LPKLEESGDYLFFLRPRRFGKSLFISMMHYYYDVFYKDRFEELFKGTWIYDNPTGERSRYLVLSLNFSRVSPEKDKVEETFLEYVRISIIAFLRKYQTIFSINEKFALFSEKIEKGGSALEILNHLLGLCSGMSQKLYIIIDEYDNFANTILSVSGAHAYRELTHGEGLLRSFFNVLKAGAGDAGAPISRLFITGRMKESLSLRDLITGEKAVQAFLNVYLGLGNLFILHSEKEMNKGYADLVMEPFLAKYELYTSLEGPFS
jgi:Predicted AAA-ATPase